MDPNGNRIQNSCSLRHWGHPTMHQVPPVSGTAISHNVLVGKCSESGDTGLSVSMYCNMHECIWRTRYFQLIHVLNTPFSGTMKLCRLISWLFVVTMPQLEPDVVTY